MNSDRFETARSLGAPREVIQLLWEGQAASPPRLHPRWSVLAERYLKERAWLPGALGPLPEEDEHHRRLLELISPRERSISVALRQLTAPPLDRPGAALFPVVSGERAALRCFRVGWPSQAPNSIWQGDSKFRSAVKLAQRFCRNLGGDSEILSKSAWWIEPELASNAGLEGGSVGFAAVAAFASWLLRCPVPSSLVFSGCLERSNQGITAAEVRPRTLPTKARAASEHRSAHVLLLHRENRGYPLGRMEERLVLSLDELLEYTFQDAGREARDELRRLPQAAVTKKLSPSKTRALAVLAVAREPIETCILERALWDEASWGSPLPSSTLVRRDLSGLEARGRIRSSGSPKAWSLAEGEAVLERFDERWVTSAHLALAGALPADRAALRAHHLLSAGRDDAVAAFSLLLHRPTLEEAWEGLERLALLHPRSRIAALLAALPSGNPLSQSLRIAWLGMDLPWPIAAVARNLIRQRSDAERLFSSQALLEALLHLLTAAADQTGAISAKLQKGLAQRPSFGILCDVSCSLCSPASDQPLHPIHDHLATHLRPAVPALDALKQGFNLILHGPGRKPDPDGKLNPGGLPVVAQDSAFAAESLLKLGEAAAALLEHARGAFAELQLHHDSGGLYLALDRNGQESQLPLGGSLRVHQTPEGQAEILWPRGTIAGQPRWWSFSSVRAIGPEAPPVPNTPWPAWDQLPQPLAHHSLPLRKNQGNLQRLAALEQTVHTLLRLAWFAGDPPISAKDRDKLKRMNARNLLLGLLEARHSPVREPLRQPATLEQVWGLVGTLERLQHAPGPAADWGELLGLAERRLRWVLGQLPWCKGELDLIGRCESGVLRYMGANKPAPVLLPPELALGGLAFWDRRGELWGLGRFGRAEKGRAWLLRQEQGRTEVCFSSTHSNHLAADLAWIDPRSRPASWSGSSSDPDTLDGRTNS